MFFYELDCFHGFCRLFQLHVCLCVCFFFFSCFSVYTSSNLLSQMLFTNEVAISIKSIAQLSLSVQHNVHVCVLLLLLFSQELKSIYTQKRGIESESKQVKLNNSSKPKHTHTHAHIKEEIAACVWHFTYGYFHKVYNLKRKKHTIDKTEQML